MRKWSYATVMMLAISSGCIYTGCIDNDEPYGIEQIRVATADLLKSKKAVAEAEAAAANAAVEIAKIQAETEKARIAIEEIKAKAEAAATELRAKADAAKTEAEAAKLKAEADALLAEAIANAAVTQAQANQIIAECEAKTKMAQLTYEKAVYEFEQQKIYNAAQANDALYSLVNDAFEIYLQKLVAFNTANENLLEAQKEYAASLVDLKWDDKNNKWVSNGYMKEQKLINAVANAQKAVDTRKADIAYYEDAITKVEALKATELAALKEKYVADRIANAEELAKANAELEALYADNQSLYDSRRALDKAWNDAKEKKVEIPFFSVTPDAALAQVPGFEAPIEVIAKPDDNAEPETFTYNNQLDPNGPYLQALDKYNEKITDVESSLLDENDKAWTKARVEEMKRELAAQNKTFEEAKKVWDNARKAYNNGAAPDFSVLPLEKEVSDAYDAYVAKAGDFTALRDAYVTAEKEYNAAIKAFNAAVEAFDKDPGTVVNTYNAAREAYNQAIDAAEETRDAAKAAANEAYNKTDREQSAIVNNAWLSWRHAQEAYDLALRQNGYNLEADAVKKAAKTLEDAQKALDKANTDQATAMANAEKTRTAAFNKADSDEMNARHTAENEWQKARQAFNAAGGYDTVKDPKYAPVIAAEKAMTDAEKKFNDAQADVMDKEGSVWDSAYKLIEVAEKQQNEIQNSCNTYWDINNIYNLVWNELLLFINGDIDKFPTTFLPSHLEATGKYTNIKRYLSDASGIAYGNIIRNDNGQFDWDYDEAFLVDVTPEVVNAYIKLKHPGMPEYNYYHQYIRFGLYGETLYLNNRIAVAEAYVANNDLINNVTAEIQKGLDALVKSKEDNDAAVEKAQEELDKVNAEILNLEEDVKGRIADLRWMENNLYNVISAINDGIAKVEELRLENSEIKEAEGKTAIKSVINALDEQLKQARTALEGNEKTLAEAQYMLDQYNNGYTEVNEKELDVKIAQNEVDEAQAAVDFAKARLDELQAKYEAASKK